jgi:hypothetical protein
MGVPEVAPQAEEQVTVATPRANEMVAVLDGLVALVVQKNWLPGTKGAGRVPVEVNTTALLFCSE